MVQRKFSEFEVKVLEKLDEISRLLNLLVELSVPPPKFDIKGLRLGKTEKAVLTLCDFRNTEVDMALKLRKKRKHISKTLTMLRKKELIRSVKFRGKTYYIRVAR